MRGGEIAMRDGWRSLRVSESSMRGGEIAMCDGKRSRCGNVLGVG